MPSTGGTADEAQDNLSAPLTIWHALGALATGGAGLAIAAVARATLGPLGTQSFAVLLLGLVLFGATVGIAAVLARHRDVPFRVVPERLMTVWINPPRDWAVLVLVFLGCAPLLALHTGVLSGADSDSAMLASSIRFVQRHGIQHLVQLQENFVPHAILGPALAISGIAGAMLVSVLSVQFLVGVCAYVTWSLSRSISAALVSAASLLSFPTIVERAVLLPMYAPMLAFGVLALFFAYRAIASVGRVRRKFAIAAGASLFLSIESHQVGQLFVILPPLLLLLTRSRESLRALAWVYGSFALAMIPRLAVNIADGGFRYLISNRVDYWITEGHLLRIQENFFEYPIRLPLGGYLREFWEGALTLVTPASIVVLLLGGLGFFLSGSPARWFGVMTATLIVAAMVYQQIPPFSRYLSPLMIGVSLAAGGGYALIRRKKAFVVRTAASVLAGVLGVTAVTTFAAQLRETTRAEARISEGPLPRLASMVRSGSQRVIGARSLHLVFVDSDVEPYGGRFLSEGEYLTYLSWPSDSAVSRVLRKHDIEWVLINPDHTLEVDYNEAWIRPAYGRDVRHLQEVSTSPNFCLALDIGGYRLYRLADRGCPSTL